MREIKKKLDNYFKKRSLGQVVSYTIKYTSTLLPNNSIQNK